MNKKMFAKIAFTVAATMPLFAFAATVGTILTDVQTILNTVIPILMILATVVFLWGVITYITAGGDEDKSKTGRTYIVWGLIGLFAMLAIWGLVRALVNTFGLTGSGNIPGGPGNL